ncbi:MAG: hypothetical protein IPP29_08335 [Bacteroidetes bacterium]|nr:hypothetical protein [Bacteroidota bacterium]MBL0051508.1 hypothetical protein [Bacteroidota bacterium]
MQVEALREILKTVREYLLQAQVDKYCGLKKYPLHAFNIVLKVRLFFQTTIFAKPIMSPLRKIIFATKTRRHKISLNRKQIIYNVLWDLVFW